MPLKLTVGFGDNPRIEPLQDGTVKPENIELEFRSFRNLFHHNLHVDDLDVSEMSISETILARERTDGTKWDWTAVPIYLSRGHGWTNICVNPTSGIKSLADLKGKRVAVPDYDMTYALWMRITLKELYGIETSDIVWYNIRTRGESHGIELDLDLDPPPGITIHWFNPDQDPAVMLERGELDAACGLSADRVKDIRRIKGLLPDAGKAVISEFYKKTGCYQPNHHVIIQRRILQEHPWVALELYRAFQRSKEVAYQRARQAQSTYLYFQGSDWQEHAAVFGEDPYPMGIRAMRRTIQRLFQGSLEQGLIRKPIQQVEDIYYPSTWDT